MDPEQSHPAEKSHAVGDDTATFDVPMDTEHEKLIPPTTTFHDDETPDVPPPSYFEMADRSVNMQQYDNTCTLVSAVLVTVLCCVPFGIVAIIKAMNARVKHAYGDAYAARDSNRSAKRWIVLGVIAGVLVVILTGVGTVLYVKMLQAQMMQAQQVMQQQMQGQYPAGQYGN